MKPSTSAAARTGVESRISRPVTSVVQVNSGKRHIVIPGARILKMVTKKLTDPKIDAWPKRITPISHISMPAPGGSALLPVSSVTGG